MTDKMNAGDSGIRGAMGTWVQSANKEMRHASGSSPLARVKRPETMDAVLQEAHKEFEALIDSRADINLRAVIKKAEGKYQKICAKHKESKIGLTMQAQEINNLAEETQEKISKILRKRFESPSVKVGRVIDFVARGIDRAIGKLVKSFRGKLLSRKVGEG